MLASIPVKLKRKAVAKKKSKNAIVEAETTANTATILSL
jgi:hypothetical protein